MEQSWRIQGCLLAALLLIPLGTDCSLDTNELGYQMSRAELREGV